MVLAGTCGMCAFWSSASSTKWVKLHNYHSRHSNSGQYSTLAAKLDSPIYFLTKLSLLLLEIRLFSPDRIFKYLILAGIVLCFLAYTAFLFCLIFFKDVLLLKVNVVMGAFNVFSDICILCLPMLAVSQLRLPRGKRFGVMLIFLSGILWVEFHSGSSCAKS